jgi:protein-S-isoprenylcysteine O-methyltransferase Ste14
MKRDDSARIDLPPSTHHSRKNGYIFQPMKATNWEFTNRAMVFGMILGVAFQFYFLDHQNSSVALANWIEPRLHWNADLVARSLFALAAVLLAFAALIRTWASAYLNAGVVYAAEVKSDWLVADGPYRQVRNPLYFANVLMAIALGAMMSRTGLFVAVAAMLVFCYRLILREEEQLQADQGEQYKSYTKAVPRLWPALRPRIASAGRSASWTEGFKAESWYWGLALAVAAFAVTLEQWLFYAILGASLAWFWISSVIFQKGRNSET